MSGSPLRLGVLISGGGTTLKNFIRQIEAGRMNAEISVVIASRSDCGGAEWARDRGIPLVVVSRGEFADTTAFSEAIFERLRAAQAELVTLAGFLSLIQVPADFLGRVINIHPSLIPAFCGRGYFGHKVHEAALDRGVKVSGCTVHFADNEYDHGPIIAQRAVAVEDHDTPETLAARVFEVECELYPEVVQLFGEGKLRIEGRRVVIEG